MPRRLPDPGQPAGSSLPLFRLLQAEEGSPGRLSNADLAQYRPVLSDHEHGRDALLFQVANLIQKPRSLAHQRHLW